MKRTIELPISHDEFRSRISYDPSSGKFHWIKARRSHLVGSEAGYKNGAGYIVITFDGTAYLGHRLAWFYVHGVWPREIDHIDRNRTNNRLSNLRDCTRTQNQLNRAPRGALRVKGITRAKGWGFQAQISDGNRTRYIGAFKTIEAAHQAYMEEARRIHGDFACGE